MSNDYHRTNAIPSPHLSPVWKQFADEMRNLRHAPEIKADRKEMARRILANSTHEHPCQKRQPD